MNWMNDIFMSFLLQILCAGILFLLWKLLSFYLQRIGAVRWGYYALKCILISFLLPFELIIYNYRLRIGGFIKGYLFTYTTIVSYVLGMLMVVWLAGSTLSVILWIRNSQHLKRTLRAGCSVHLETGTLLCEIADKLNIHKKIQIYQNDQITTPFIIGAISPKVYIPSQRYEQNELEIILTHELMHYKHKDLFLKYFGIWLLCIQWFNPVVRAIIYEIDQWCEFYCDYSVCMFLGNSKAYFSSMLQFQTNSRNLHLTAMLFEKDSKFKRRVENMKYSQMKVKNRSFKIIFSLLLFICCGTCSVYAADTGFKAVYAKAVDTTMIEVPEEPVLAEDTLIEYEESGEIDASITIVDAPESQTKAGNPISWSIGKKQLMQSAPFYVNSGTAITVTLLGTPSDVNLKAGIVSSSGIRYYVIFSDYMNHSFKAAESGNYRVFIENSNDVSVNVSGVYHY